MEPAVAHRDHGRNCFIGNETSVLGGGSLPSHRVARNRSSRYTWSQIGFKNPVIAGLFILAFVGGVRGTSALYRIKKTATQHSEGLAT